MYWVSHFENHQCMKQARTGWHNLVVCRVTWGSFLLWVRFFWKGTTINSRTTISHSICVYLCNVTYHKKEAPLACEHELTFMCIVVPSKYKTIDPKKVSCHNTWVLHNGRWLSSRLVTVTLKCLKLQSLEGGFFIETHVMCVGDYQTKPMYIIKLYNKNKCVHTNYRI